MTPDTNGYLSHRQILVVMGGLMALALATIGDVVPPRERPRYQGYIAGTFGASSVLGPVLGGFFADGPGWQWIFFMNVPIGLVALVVTSVALKMQHVRRDHTIDYLGAALVVGAVSSFLLYTAWAGPDEGWGSTIGIGLLAAGVVLAVAFVAVELRAKEPILPMRLFRNSIFSIANAFGFLVGVAMFGALIFIPVYLQVVDGMSPTQSGLAMLPMIVGLFSTSIAAGRLAPAGRSAVASARCVASRLDRIAPNSAVPNEPPIWRKNATELVATPMSERSTEFCTTTISTCIVRPRPSPITNIERPANQ